MSRNDVALKFLRIISVNLVCHQKTVLMEKKLLMQNACTRILVFMQLHIMVVLNKLGESKFKSLNKLGESKFRSHVPFYQPQVRRRVKFCFLQHTACLCYVHPEFGTHDWFRQDT